MKTIDLNADLGEGIGNDAALMGIISSANIACGGHAGDAQTMRHTLRLAHANGISCGAHPGFVDKKNFGRARLNLSSLELTEQIQSQLTHLFSIAEEEGVPVRYLKLHGALANMAAEDAAIAKIVFMAAAKLYPKLPILALENSAQVFAADALDLPVLREAYADRAYTAHGLLVSRSAQGAVLTNPDAVTRQCIQLAAQGTITAIDGTVFESNAQSVCLHGDTLGAVNLATKVRAALENAGIVIKACV